MSGRLYTKSRQVILENQSKWGSYIASPAFPTYHFSWLRDGSFIAHAMDTAGEHESATSFFQWLGNTIGKYAPKLEQIRQTLDQGLLPGKDDVLHTRFTLDGKEDTQDESWGNFQVDGYGTWLWALAEHVRITDDTKILQEVRPAILITLEYLGLVWSLPNYDCWEEHPEYIHTYSLGAVYAGFQAAATMMNEGWLTAFDFPAAEKALEVKAFIEKYAVADQRLAKMIQPATNDHEPFPIMDIGVDASLLGLMLPYGVFDMNSEIMQNTLKKIEQDLLRPQGGIYRYTTDEYYGGGEWILLTAWLGWIYAKTGRIDKAEILQAWIEACADENELLAEQINDYVLLPHHYQPWVEKWGVVAKPLLWSHAMYIILVNEINKGKQHD
ncbi:MAG: glycoside hydrolase family 15 protein [Anaerolineaceae bacterium]|nr:glycoside hydrolase family 15 protein [Anaerolineaceae bacterium]